MLPQLADASEKGLKTETRRCTNLDEVNKRPNDWIPPILDSTGEWVFSSEHGPAHQVRVRCPYGDKGDLLYIKETHYAYGEWEPNGSTKTGKQKWVFKPHMEPLGGIYMLEPPGEVKPNTYRKEGWYKRSPLFMPKRIARKWFRRTLTGIERLHDIDWKGAKSEGIKSYWDKFGSSKNGLPGVVEPGPNQVWTKRDAFEKLWISINGSESWDANPWVWVIGYERIPITLGASTSF